MAALREVLAKFGVSFDDSQLKKGDKAIDGVVEKLTGLGAALVGGAVIHGIKEFVLGMADQADALKDHADRLGVSTDALQSWQYAAKLSGVQAEEFNSSLTKFSKSVADAAAGTGPAADAFRSLGVSVQDGSGKLGQPIELLEGVAAGIAKIENPAERVQKLMQLFGKGGAALGPLFENGAENITKLRQEFEDLGGGMSPEFIERSAAMNDSIDRLNLAWLSFKTRIGGLVIPLIDQLAQKVAKITGSMTKWIDKTGALTDKTNLAVGAAVVLGTAFAVAGLKAILPWLPMIATFAGLILLVDELITLWQGGDTLIGRAIDRVFGEGTQKKVTAWLQDVVKSVQFFFADTTKGWNDFKIALELLWFDLTTSLSNGWRDFTAGIQLMLVDLVTAVGGAVADVEDAFARMFNKLQSIPGASKVLGKLNEGNRAAVDANAAQVRAGILGQTDHDQAAIAAQRLAIVRAGEDRVGGGGGTATYTDNSQTNVTVPPGTTPQQAKQIADAVQKAKGPSNKAMFNALVKTGG